MTPSLRSCRRASVRFLAGLLAVALPTACASGPYQAEVLAVGAAKLNPTFDQKPSAVNIRLVALQDKDAFLNASDADLRADPPKLPSGTWTPPHKDDVVYVDQKCWIDFEIKPGVRYVGVVGMFNEEHPNQRLLLEVGELKKKKLVFADFAVALADRESGDRK